MKRGICMTMLLHLLCMSIGADSLTGKVVDEMHRGVAYANVVMLSLPDSAFVTGTVSGEDGTFTIATSPSGEGLLKFSCLGYATRVLPLSGFSGEIVLREDNILLHDVEVVAERPVFRQKDGALVTRVAGTALSNYHRMDDLLAALPGMAHTASGTLEVFGLGAPIVYINGRKARADELRQLTPKDICSIELLTNPGARYDADGKAVLNVSTVKREDGYAFLAEHESEQGRRYSHYETLRYDYWDKRLRVSGYYQFADYRSVVNQPQSHELAMGDSLYLYRNPDQHDRRDTHQHSWYANADYGLSEKHTIGLKVEGTHTREYVFRAGRLDYGFADAALAYKEIANDYHNGTDVYHANLFYNAEWSDKLSSALNLDYVHNGNRYRQETAEEGSAGRLDTESHGRGRLSIYSGQLAFDYRPDSHLQLSFGADVNRVHNHNELQSDAVNVSASLYDEDERRAAVFAEGSFSAGRFSFRAGIRYEYMDMEFKDYLNSRNNLRRDFHNVYPSASVSYERGGWNQTLSFSSRTTRPSFRQLSNAVYYSNEFMFQRGNPLLLPATSYKLAWSVGHQPFYLNVSYTYEKNHLSTYQEEEAGNRIVSTFCNYDRIQYLKATLNLQKTFGIWHPSLTLGISQPFFKVLYRGETLAYNSPNCTATLNQQFTFKRDYQLNVYYAFYSGGDLGSVSIRPYQMLNLQLQKDFLKKRLSVSLNAYDLFRTMKFREEQREGNLHFTQTEDYQLWNFSVNLVFRFNQLKNSYRGKNTSAGDMERL